MVGAISEELKKSVPEILEGIGFFWVQYVDEHGFGPLLSASGRTFEEFIENLGEFHSRLAMTDPKFRPPEFDSEYTDDGRIELTYSSIRKGLTPMVEGIIHGLAHRYDVDVELDVEASDTSAKFLIRVLEQATTE